MVLLLCGCALGEAPRREAAIRAGPSGKNIADAIAASLPPVPTEEGGYVCAIVRDLKCVPIRPSGRFQCAYRQTGEPVTTVVEYGGPEERERQGTEWRWVEGERDCGILF